MKLILSKTNISQFSSFMILQGINLGAALLRLPLISSRSDVETLVCFLLWSGVLPVAQLISLGQVNRARINYILGKVYKFQPDVLKVMIGGAIMVLFLILGGLVEPLSEMLLFLPGVCAFLSVLVVSSRLANYFGQAQAKNMSPRLNYISAASAVISLGLTWVSYYFGLGNTSSYVQVSVLLFLTVTSTITSYLAAYVIQRKDALVGMKVVFESSSKFPNIPKIKQEISELLFTLPPILFTATDLFFLSIVSNPNQLIQYAFYSRCAVVSSILPAALYLPISNQLTAPSDDTSKVDLVIMVRLILLNLPFMAVFVAASPQLSSFLSDGITWTDYPLVSAFVSASLLQPIWIVVQSRISSREVFRSQLGIKILKYLIPISLMMNLIGAWSLGAAGVVLSTTFSYLVALGLAKSFYRSLQRSALA